MRIFLSIAVLTVIIAALASLETTAAKQHPTLTIDPLGMTTTTTGLTTVQYDAF
jgi:hypothetical protein